MIDCCLTNSAAPYPDKDTLRRACEEALYGSEGEHISESTIEKDLWAMRNESELGYYAPIRYSKEHRGYYYEEEDYSINSLSLNDEDLEAIRFAATTLYQFRSVPIFKQYEHAIEKIIDRMNIHPDLDDVELSRYVQFEQAEAAGGTEWLSPVLAAIKSNKQLLITYRKFNSEEQKEYLVDPYLLKEYRNRWYLIAQVAERERIQTFGLERMVQVKENGQRFRHSENFNPDLFFKHSIGISQAESEATEILLRFNPDEAPYLKTLPIHSSQQIISENNHELLIRLYVLETYELYSLLLSYGDKVEVLSPSRLRERFKGVLESALKKYGGT